MKLKLLVLLITSIIVSAMLFLRPHMRVDWRQPEMIRMRRAIDIEDALNKYQLEHRGRLPVQLVELVTNYVAPSNMNLLFLSPKPGDPRIALHAIDNSNIFIYLGERGLKENLLLYERTNFWPQDRDVKGVLTITSNFCLSYRSVKDIEARISNLKN